MEGVSQNGIVQPDKDQLMDLAAAKMTALEQSEAGESNHNGLKEDVEFSENKGAVSGNGSAEHKAGREEAAHEVDEKGEGHIQSNGSNLNACSSPARAAESSPEAMDTDEENRLLGEGEDDRDSDSVKSSEADKPVEGEKDLDQGHDDQSITLAKDETSVEVSKSLASDQEEEDMEVDSVTEQKSNPSSPAAITDETSRKDVTTQPEDTAADEPKVKDKDSEGINSKKNVDDEKTDSAEKIESKSDGHDIDSKDKEEAGDKTSSNKEPSPENSSDKTDPEKSSKKIVLDDGDELIITLNEESDHEEKNTEKASVDKPPVKPGPPPPASTQSSSGQVPVSTTTPAAVNKPALTSASVTPSTSTMLIPISSSGQFFVQPGAVTTAGYGPQFTVVQQYQGKQQTGYITKIGNQAVFVPLHTSVKAQGKQNTMVPVSGGQQPPKLVSISNPTTTTNSPAGHNVADLTPKSSLEMIELMKWELQNKIPDNHSWSVVFHHRKDMELSSVTSFLLELGHDVVKESVYKDIIQIQTKKKELGKLKEGEVESLEKMKSVYDDTKKKVEHLHLKTVQCEKCKFSTESARVLDFHKDYPHFYPPNDVNGELLCSHCDFRTKQVAVFAFHMEAFHQLKGRMPEKGDFYKCELCPFESNSKNKVTKHRFKCSKNFKLHINLQPYFHDVNYCLKNLYYKPKRPVVVPKPPPDRQKPRVVPIRQPPITTKSMYQPRPTPPIIGPRLAAPTAVNPSLLPRKGVPALNPLRTMLPQKQPGLSQPQKPSLLNRPALPPPSKQVASVALKAQQQVSPQQVPRKPDMSGFEVCELCGGYVKDRHALRIHFYYAHKVEMPLAIFNRPTPPLVCEVCQSRFWTTQGLSKHKSSLRHYGPASTPVTSPNNQQCFMCLRRVANLFVHVEQVHGMTMKDLVAMKKCIMCGLTASNRRQLEIHMASQHGVLIKANDFLGPEKDGTPGTGHQQPHPTATATVNKASPKGPAALVRNNLCVFCQVQFQDNIQLTMHCIKNHATCTACGMVVASSRHLASHSCKKKTKDCQVCGIKRLSLEAYNVHITKHTKACKVKLRRMTTQDIEKARRKMKQGSKLQVICLDSDDNSDDDSSPLKQIIDREKLKKLEQFKVEPVLSDDEEFGEKPDRKSDSKTNDEEESAVDKSAEPDSGKIDKVDGNIDAQASVKNKGKDIDSSDCLSKKLASPDEENVQENTESPNGNGSRKRNASGDVSDSENESPPKRSKKEPEDSAGEVTTADTAMDE